MTTNDRAQARSALRAVGIGVACVGLVMVLFGLQQRAQVPAELPMPHAGNDFLNGRVSIDEVGQRNDDWFERSRKRAEAQFASTALLMLGAFVGIVGMGLFAQGSRRLMQMSTLDQEANAEAIARGFKRGMADDDDDRGARDPNARLAKLDSLRAQGLVTPEEYQAKRSDILAEL